MLENLLIWTRNRQNNTATFHYKVMIENFRTKRGWNYPSCGYEKCRKGATRKIGKWVCEACKRTVDYPVFRYMLEVVIIPNSPAEDGASFNTAAVTANDVESPMKILTKPPTVCTPLKPNEEKKQKGHALKDSDVDEVSGPQKNTRNSNAEVAVDTQKKRKRPTARGYGPAQEFKYDALAYRNNPKDNPGMKTRL
ncbi:replication protein A 70 kDa DNA-binding subunit C-like protein [Tanacetum coccineum]